MRPEVVEAIERARAITSRYSQTSMPSEQHQGLIVQYPDRDALDRMGYIDKLRDEVVACLQSTAGAVEVYEASAVSINVRWSDNEQEHLVIELSWYGPLVALFPYGQPPASLVENLRNCLESAKLIRLEADEIRELEELGEYLNLFE